MRRLAVAGSMVLVALVWAAPAASHGAIAVGQPADVTRGGVAFGVSWDEPTAAAAQQAALGACRQADYVPQSTLALCRVVHTFKGQCVSVAVDPQAGTTGFGWGAGADTTASGWAALDKCRATAGNRASACRVIDNTCD